MDVTAHPDYAYERAHLKGTVDICRREHESAVRDRREAEGELANARMYEPDALPIREMLYTRAVMLEHSLEKAISRPYFTRLDYAEKPKGVRESCYIGKYAVLDTETFDPVVSDWRSPIANLYYSGQIGDVNYTTPEGRIEAELFLKRQFSVEAGELTAILDADIVSQDEYLKSVLAAASGDKLKDIVTTIQAEQNNVIRCPLEKNLIVQGAAGSGKTTVALHRIAYLLYAYSKSLEPQNLLILAPSPLFLTFISQVLPDLGVESVNQTTYTRYAGELLEGVKTSEGPSLASVRELSGAEFKKTSDILRTKGSRAFILALEEWLDGFLDRFVPEGDISFGPVRLFDESETRAFLLEEQKGVPLSRRLFEFRKLLKARVAGAVDKLGSWYEGECRRRILKLADTTDDVAERAKKTDKLNASLALRKKQLKEQADEFIRDVMGRFGDISPKALYRGFLKSVKDDERFGEAARAALASKKYAREDLAPLLVIALRATEVKRAKIRHIVIDEAQDFSYAEFHALKKAHPSATFTIVGDLAQGVYAYRSLSSWSEARAAVGKSVDQTMETSYRSSVEIMEFASRVNRNMPVEGVGEAKPVLRHGDKVIYEKGSAKEALALAEKWLGEGMGSVALIAPGAAAAKRTAKELGLSVLSGESEVSTGGVNVISCEDVKGLEFDAAIVLDADSYKTDATDARLLYVCLTRALHKMAVFEKGPSPLLRER